jgi:hypothetical protein
MTFDELWRVNLAPQQRRTDSAKRSTPPVVQPVIVKDPDELELTEEDRLFLSQVGIRP